ncbi:hypothetical protein [Eudoraea sp.]|uniref:hypothetical protein n=1 Tax=Eudoraea sp. TaxID=1979955 RepID=UPI003C78E9AD
MKKIKHLIILLFSSFFFFVGCEQEQLPDNTISQDEVLNYKNEVRFLDSSQIPHIMDEVVAITKQDISTMSSRNNESNYYLDTQNVQAVTDSVGNVTYAFRLYLKNGKENAFYNLLATERKSGKKIPMAVLEYNMEPSYFMDLNSDFIKSIGGVPKINYYSFKSFFKGSNRNKYEVYVPNDPCGEVSGGSSGGSSAGTGTGGGGGTSNGDISTSGGTSIGWTTLGSSDGGTNTTQEKGTVYGGDGCFCESFESEGGDDQKNGYFTGKDDDCPEGELLFPVNEGSMFDKLDLDDLNNPCVENIIKGLSYKDMKNLVSPSPGEISGTGHLSQGILDMFDNSEEFHLSFQISERGAGINANTLPETDNSNGVPTWIVALDDDFVRNATRLAIARTLIHESLHAFIGQIISINFTGDFAAEMQEYRKISGSNVADHAFMAEYAEAIGYSLAVWDSHRLPQSYYNNLAWSGGMIKNPDNSYTSAFLALPEGQRTSILAANNAEGTANNSSTGDAKGSKCKK